MHLQTVQQVLAHRGPFVTVHAEVGRGSEDAAQQLEARWSTIRARLEEEGVSADLAGRIRERLHENPHLPGETRLTVVAAEDDVVLTDLQNGTSHWPETVDVDALPDLAGWLTLAEGQLSFVLAVVDREGADIEAYESLLRGPIDESTVQGDDFPIRKVPHRNFSQKQFQQSAENTWKRNAADVAEEITSMVRSGAARLVLVAGDERARTEVVEALDGVKAEVVQVTSGGRAAGASTESLWTEVHQVLAQFRAHEERELLESLTRARGDGQGQAGVHGLHPVLDALVKGQVERVVLDLAAVRDATVRLADHPGLALPNGEDDLEASADRVLIAAAAATNAEVTLLPAEQTGGDGVAALLRWAE